MIRNFAAPGRAHSLAILSAVIPLLALQTGSLSWALSMAAWLILVGLVVLVYRATDRPAGPSSRLEPRDSIRSREPSPGAVR